MTNAEYRRAATKAGIMWKPGAFTPARCALWRTLDDERQGRLTRWILREEDRGVCHSQELPKMETTGE